MDAELIVGIDQGTTSTRAIAFDRSWRPVAHATRPLDTIHPAPGWIELDPEAVLASVVDTVADVIEAVGGAGRVAAVGLANQGETVVAWDADSGRALAPAIVWGCRRSEPIVERVRAAGLGDAIRALTGLPLDPYFSASKLSWLLEEVPAVANAADQGTLRFGTVDAWVTARLATASPGGLTDPSTASRTQLYGLDTGDWHPDDYHDTYHEDLLKLIDKRIKAGETEVISTTESQETTEEPSRGNVVDLMALLKRSVQDKAKRRSSSNHRREGRLDGPRRKTA